MTFGAGSARNGLAPRLGNATLRRAALLVALAAAALFATPSSQAMGRAPRLDLRSFNVKHSYRHGQPISFDLELRNRGNVGQSVIVLNEETILAQPAVRLVFVVSRRSDGGSFRIFPAGDRARAMNAASAPLETLGPGKFRRVRLTWDDSGRWNWLHERDWAQAQLTESYRARADVVGGVFGEPGLYNVRAVVTVEMPGDSRAPAENEAGAPWKGRLVSVPFTILIRP